MQLGISLCTLQDTLGLRAEEEKDGGEDNWCSAGTKEHFSHKDSFRLLVSAVLVLFKGPLLE